MPKTVDDSKYDDDFKKAIFVYFQIDFGTNRFVVHYSV